jgi:glycosyltransferase involved in cell wall biosynthesis
MTVNNKDKPLISVITCAHNEENYVGKSLNGVLRALKDFKSEIVFVADRCTDSTVHIAKKHKTDRLIEKTWKRWQNSYAEALQTGFSYASGSYVSIVDADIVIPEDFFKKLVPLVNNQTSSVSARVRTYPNTLTNRLFYAWEQTHEITPFGREPRGAARVMLRRVLDEINGFRDVIAPDTDLDQRLEQKGYKSIYFSSVSVWHIRNITLGKTISAQLNSGRTRYNMGAGIVETLGHAVFRGRPFVVYGWISEWLSSTFLSKKQRALTDLTVRKLS